MSTFSLDERVLGDPPAGICQCGCGKPTRFSDRTDPKRGVVRGRPLRFVNGHARRGHRRKRYEPQDRGYKTPCWIWLLAVNGKTGYGYEYGEDGTRKLAHRVVYEKLIGPIPTGLQLDHLCRNHACVNPEHLEPVTNAENTRRGDRAKLTYEDVAAIRASGLSQGRLGETYGVHPAHISRIQSGKRWG